MAITALTYTSSALLEGCCGSGGGVGQPLIARLAGSIATWMCPWGRRSTPSCSWWAGQRLAWQLCRHRCVCEWTNERQNCKELCLLCKNTAILNFSPLSFYHFFICMSFHVSPPFLLSSYPPFLISLFCLELLFCLVFSPRLPSPSILQFYSFIISADNKI